MKVKELIEMLSEFDAEMEIGFSYNYGDHWNTAVVEDISTIDEEQVQWSDYHSMNKIADDEDEKTHTMLILG